jgi:hypothetical protein
MCPYILEKRALYQMYAQHGLTYSAFFELGMALHPVMDSTSPAHEGFQRWNGVLKGPSTARFQHHWRPKRWRVTQEMLPESGTL